MKEMLRRTLRTFVQAALGYVGANIVTAIAGETDPDMVKTALVGLGVSALAAGIAAIMNIPKGESIEDNENG